MRWNVDRFFADKSDIDFSSGTIVLRGDDVKHISNVLRMRVGDGLEVCDKENSEYYCEIEDISKKEVVLKIVEKINIDREPNVRVRIYQGVPKGQRLDFLTQKLTEVGVYEIVLVDMDRCVSDISQKSDKKLARLNKIAYEAAKQSKRGIIPQIRGPLSMSEAIDDMMSLNEVNMCPYEQEESLYIKDFLRGLEGGCSSIGVLIGPEGGFSDEEIELIVEKGISTITLGPRILRTETAGVNVVSNIIYELY